MILIFVVAYWTR